MTRGRLVYVGVDYWDEGHAESGVEHFSAKITTMPGSYADEQILISKAELAAEIAEAEERGARRMHWLLRGVWCEGANMVPIQSEDTAMTMWLAEYDREKK